MIEKIIQNEKNRIQTIEVAEDHILAREKWFEIKRVLDTIYKEISPIGNEEEHVDIAPDEFKKNALRSVLEDLLKNKITSYDRNDSGGGVVFSSEPLRKYYSGKITVKNKDLFFEYRNDIASLFYFINKDGKDRFPNVYNFLGENESIENGSNESDNAGEEEKLERVKESDIIGNVDDPFLLLQIRDKRDYDEKARNKLESYSLTKQVKKTTNGNEHYAIINSDFVFRIRNDGNETALNIKIESENFIGSLFENRQIATNGDEQSVKVVKKPNNKIRDLRELNNEIFKISCDTKNNTSFLFNWEIRDFHNKDIRYIKEKRENETLREKNSTKQEDSVNDENINSWGGSTGFSRNGCPARKVNEIKPSLGVENLAEDISKIINNIKGKKGAVFGVFGKWGRGKTYLINKIKEQTLIEDNFYPIDFSAWKYQDTPASWAYLYENLAKDYYSGSGWNLKKILRSKNKKEESNKDDRSEKNDRIINSIINLFNKLIIFIFSYLRVVKLNFCRHKIWSILFFFTAVAINYYWISIPILEKLNTIIGVNLWSQTNFNISIIALTILFFKHKKTAKKLLKEYTIKKDFIKYLGVQHEIQEEIGYLLKAWPKINKGKKNILLIVDDIDRCSEEKIIEIVDSLWLMLDDDEISKKIVVLLAIDDSLLKRAVKYKYSKIFTNGIKEKSNELEILTREYLDKLFLSGIRLGNLTNNEKTQILDNVVNLKIKNTNKEGEEEKAEETTKTIDQSEQAKPERINIPEEKTISTNDDELIDNIEIDEIENELLKKALIGTNNITPRQIDIFHFRYILARDILWGISGSGYDPFELAKKILEYTTGSFDLFEKEVVNKKVDGNLKTVNKVLEMVIIY